MSLHTALVKIEEKKISSEEAKKFILSQKNGAEAIFIGRVRNKNEEKEVIAVTYDAHDQAVLKSLMLHKVLIEFPSYPPVTFMFLGTNFSSPSLSMAKSCPFGFLEIASYITFFKS